MTRKIVLVLSMLLGVATMSSSAEAKTNCTVIQIQYDAGRLAVWCANDGTNIYYAFTNSGCTNQSLDTVKIWMSMFQGQMLSGRPVDFFTTAASGSCPQTIVSVDAK